MHQSLHRSNGGTTYISATGTATVLVIEPVENGAIAQLRDTDYTDGTLTARLLVVDIEDADLIALARHAQVTGEPIAYEAQWWPNGTQEPGQSLDLTLHGDITLVHALPARARALA